MQILEKLDALVGVLSCRKSSPRELVLPGLCASRRDIPTATSTVTVEGVT